MEIHAYIITGVSFALEYIPGAALEDEDIDHAVVLDIGILRLTFFW